MRSRTPADALEVLEPEITRLEEGGRLQELSLTRLILAETILQLGRSGEAALEAESGLTDAIEHGQVSLTWQYRLVLARAYDAIGRSDDAAHARETAASEVAALAACIADPQLRATLEGQPGLHRWARPAPATGDRGD